MCPAKPRRGKPGPAPRKSLGQNFLISHAIRDRIVSACEVKTTDTVVEIGPGKGVLSRVLAPAARKLILVEKDFRMVNLLNDELSFDNTVIEHDDILKYKLPKVNGKILLIGNIPYNISTPIIEYAIANRNLIKTVFLTVQKEFGQRLAASPGSKAYGSLSIYCQYYADMKVLFKIKRTAFFPIPKVDSCFVRMNFHRPHFRLADEQEFFRFVQQTFTQRRKTLLNGLSFMGNKDDISGILDRLDISTKTRAETLPLEKFVEIYRKVKEILPSCSNP